MKYLCLICNDEEKLDALSQPQLDDLVCASVGWVEELEKGGHHIYSAGLQSPATTATVRHRNGKALVTDGPFTESKEVVGGFTLIEARDLNEAIQLASRFPDSHPGSIQVRPVLEPGYDPGSPLDRKIAEAFRRSASVISPGTASRIASIPAPAP